MTEDVAAEIIELWLTCSIAESDAYGQGDEGGVGGESRGEYQGAEDLSCVMVT